ncbi:MAG: aminotransferase [Gammaproteobacteria bacterium]|jgi:histidinol-phosphate aminotransferase|nr:aminotransferase [Gammaproteobacteria bacterium]MBU0890027.1 aminotransferase [Gammaproteobacteria bacterium]MBU1353421.1 aminotransferase [Gammaproteobacteria bacterium]MBU1508373.1 aminotransferase [Gammaproteobacteria bacterium]MBU1815898.1 aminotransferase [Gammaproteobacteria bacterium]
MTLFNPAPAPAPLHGGPDADGVPAYDFSTNSNACGPCPMALGAVRAADATRYPDPAYTALRGALGAFHGVSPERIVLAASASEFIHRITALAVQQGAVHVSVPLHSYGDYAQAAQARGLKVVRGAGAPAGLQWACEPSSPLGLEDPAPGVWRQGKKGDPARALRVLDCAYVPLRLDAEGEWAGAPSPRLPSACWQLWTPNKALGLTGVRAAYAIAPAGNEDSVCALAALAPSWPVGAHGVALLQAWVLPGVQQWLVHSLATLRDWKARQQALCMHLGWAVQAGSLANYFCAQPTRVTLQSDLVALRSAGIKLRDATSFGLPGTVRLGVLAPAAQDALAAAWQALQRGRTIEDDSFSTGCRETL